MLSMLFQITPSSQISGGQPQSAAGHATQQSDGDEEQREAKDDAGPDLRVPELEEPGVQEGPGGERILQRERCGHLPARATGSCRLAVAGTGRR